MPSLRCLNCDARLDAAEERELRLLVERHVEDCRASMAFVRIPTEPAPR